MSTSKNARSAHVEIPKVERLRMREGRKEGKERSAWRPGDPQLRHEVNACSDLFLYTCLSFSDCPQLSFQSSRRLRFSCSSVSRYGGSVNGLDFLRAGSHRAHDKELKSVGALGAYCDQRGQCFTGPPVFPV